MDDTRTLHGVEPANTTMTPAFMLLFAIRLAKGFSSFGAPSPGVTPLSPELEWAYLGQFSDFEGRLLGEAFLEAHRIKRWPLGRITLNGKLPNAPAYADVTLLVHTSGVALWEARLPAPDQPFDAARWIAWLNPDAENSLVARLWRVLGPINQEIAGEPRWSGLYFPITVLRAPQQPLEAIVEGHAADLIRLLFLDHGRLPLKADLVREEIERDYCGREGGMTLLGRRSGLNLHGRQSVAEDATSADLPPRTALPFIITIELLLLEHTVLQQLYQRLSISMPRSIDELLALKQEVLDALEEYYGAITTATRMSEAVTVDGERLLGIAYLYDAVMNRLDAVSFEITTRYQQRMTVLQFWLTIVFGATEIGFIASSIATWYFRTGLGTVLAWTIGGALASGLVLVALLRGRLK